MADDKYKKIKITPPAEGTNIPPYNPTEEEQKVLETLDKYYYEASEARKKREVIWNYSYLQFKSINYYNKRYSAEFLEGFGLRVVVPKTFETIESIIPQINGRPPEFIIDGQNPTDKDKAKFMNVILTNEFRRADAQKEFTVCTFDALVLGTGILFNYLRSEQRDVEVIDEADENGNVISYKSQTITDYFGVFTQAIDPYTFFPDPIAEEVSDMRYCIIRERVDVDKLKEEYSNKNFNENWKYICPGGNVDDFAKVRKEIDMLYSINDKRYPGNVSDLVGGTKTNQSESTTRNLAEKFTMWTKERLVVISNGVVLRNTPNPYLRFPFTLIRDYKCSHELWGMGEPEIMRWLAIEADTLHNMTLDATSMGIGQMIAVNSAYIQDESELIVKPFGIVHLKNVPGVSVADAISPIITPDVKNSSFRMIQLNKELVQSTTGISDYFIGASRGAADTATEANKLADASAARIREKARIIEDEGIKDVLYQWINIIAQFYSDEMNFRVTDRDKTQFFKFVPLPRAELTPEKLSTYLAEGYSDVISMDDVRGKFDIYVKGASTLPVNKDVLRNQNMQLMNLAIKAVRPDGTPIFKQEKIAEDVLYSFDNPNPQDYINYPQAPEQIPPAPVPLETPITPETPTPPMTTEADILNQAAQPTNLGINTLEQ
jgi:hypothetical protein